MASIEELVSLIQADVQHANEGVQRVEATKNYTEELSSSFQSMSADAIAMGAQGVKQTIDEGQQHLLQAIAKFEEAMGQAQNLRNQG